MVTTGQTAPDFIAPALVDGEGVMLELFREIETHEAVVLYFSPADFVPECTAALLALRDAGWQAEPALAVVGLSGDSLFSHAAYAAQYDLPVPLVSDFHGGVADSYGLLAAEWEGHSSIPTRGAVVIDGDWTVETVATTDPLARPSRPPVEDAAETLRALGFDVDSPEIEYGAVPATSGGKTGSERE